MLCSFLPFGKPQSWGVSFGYMESLYASCILMRSSFHMLKEMPQWRDVPHWWVLKVHKTTQQLDFLFRPPKFHPSISKTTQASCAGVFPRVSLWMACLINALGGMLYHGVCPIWRPLRKKSVDLDAWRFWTRGESQVQSNICANICFSEGGTALAYAQKVGKKQIQKCVCPT